MAIVGSAHVVIRALTDKLKDDIQKGLNDAISGAGAAGSQAGSDFKKQFTRSAKIDSGASKQLLDPVKNGANGSGVGTKVGKDLAQGVERGMRSEEARLGNSSGGFGNRVGRAFTNGFNNSGALKAFSSVALRLFTLGPILGSLVSAISNVVSGLFAMASAASNAVNVLAVLPGLVSAIAQGGLTLFAAFKGVGTAISAGFKAAAKVTGAASTQMRQKATDAAKAVKRATQGVADAERNAARQIQDAIRGVRDAKEQLMLTYMNAADSERSAAESVASAEYNLAQAHRSVMDAQKALTQARIDAKNRLIDLQFASEGGSIAERRAVLALKDARYQLNATNELPVNNRVRQDAQLGYDEAVLSLKEIREQNRRNAVDLNKFHKTGIKGSDEVTQAQRNLIDAEHGVHEAVQAVTDALRSQKEVGIQNAIAIRNAQEAVARAQRDLGDAYREGPRSIQAAKDALEKAQAAAKKAGDEFKHNSVYVDAYNRALANLSPPARAFVKYIVSLRDEFKRLQSAAGAGLFPPLTNAIKKVVGVYLPILSKVFKETGAAIGDAMGSIAKAITSGPFTRQFKVLAEDNIGTIRRMGKIIADLVVALTNLMTAARPITRQFTKWLTEWADGLRKGTSGAKNIDKMRDAIQKGADTFKQWVRIIKNIIEGIFDFGKIAAQQGQIINNHFERATKSFADFTDTKKHRKSLEEFFTSTRKNFLPIAHMLGVLAAAFLKMGTNPALAGLAKSLEPVIKKLQKVLEDMVANSGPALVKVLSGLLDLVYEVAQSGAFQAVAGLAADLFNALTNLLRGPAGPALKWLIKAVAVMQVLSFIRKFPGLGLVADTFKKAGTAAHFLFSKNADGIRGFTVLKNKAHEFYTAVRNAPSKVMSFAGDAKAWIQLRAQLLKTKALQAKTFLATKAQHAWQATARARDWVAEKAKFVWDKAVHVAKLVWAGIERAAQAIGGSWFTIIAVAIAALVAGIVYAYKHFEWFHKVVDKVWHAIVDGAKWVWDVLFGHSIFPDIQDAMQAVWDNIGGIVMGAWDVIKVVFDYMSRFVTSVLIPAFKVLMGYVQVAFQVIGTVIQWAWEHVIQPALKAFWWYLTNVYIPVIKFLWEKIVKPYFTLIANIIVWAWEHVILPALKAFWWYLTNVYIPVIKFLWNNIVKPYFTLIANIIKWAWEHVIWPALKAMWWYLTNVLIPIIKFLWKNVIKPIWEQISAKIQWAWQNVISPVFDALKTGIGKVKDAFETAIHRISDLWDSLKNAASTAVKFVIDAVYNNGIRKVVNSIPGIPGELPAITFGGGSGSAGSLSGGGASGGHRKKAMGGVLPGYTPGRDVHHFVSSTGGRLSLSGGEAIMRPEWTRAVGGEDAVNRMNQLARTGSLAMPTLKARHASGGVLPMLKTRHDSVREMVKMRHDSARELAKMRHDTVRAMPDLKARHAMGGVIGPMPGPKRWAPDAMMIGPKPDPKRWIRDRANALRKQGIHHFATGGVWRPTAGGTYGSVHDEWTGFPAVDIRVGTGTPVHAVAPGTVTVSEDLATSYGHWIKVAHAGFQSLYAHLERRLVGKGAKVAGGQEIGISDSTGNSTGPHLHFGVAGLGPDGPLRFMNASTNFTGPGSDVGDLGGGLGFNPLGFLHLDKWKSKLAKMGEWGGMMKDMVGNVVPSLVSWAKGKIGSFVSDGLGLGNSGGPVKDIVQGIASRSGWGSGAEWSALSNLIAHESSWNPTAQNGGSTAYGLFQFLDTTWASVGGHKTSDPGLQTQYGLAYIAHKYKDPIGAWNWWQRTDPRPIPGHWYDDGGMAFGTGYMEKKTIKPERVLSPRQTEAFERLVSAMENGTTGGGDVIKLDVHVPQEASAREVVDGIVYELRRARRGGRYR